MKGRLEEVAMASHGGASEASGHASEASRKGCIYFKSKSTGKNENRLENLLQDLVNLVENLDN